MNTRTANGLYWEKGFLILALFFILCGVGMVFWPSAQWVQHVGPESGGDTEYVGAPATRIAGVCGILFGLAMVVLVLSAIRHRWREGIGAIDDRPGLLPVPDQVRVTTIMNSHTVTAGECFFMAKASYKLRQDHAARQWYDEGVRILETERIEGTFDSDDERSRAEVATLLNIAAPPVAENNV